MLGGLSREEIDPDLEVEEDIVLLDDMEKHWNYAVNENNKDKGKVHALRWEVYTK